MIRSGSEPAIFNLHPNNHFHNFSNYSKRKICLSTNIIYINYVLTISQLKSEGRATTARCASACRHTGAPPHCPSLARTVTTAHRLQPRLALAALMPLAQAEAVRPGGHGGTAGTRSPPPSRLGLYAKGHRIWRSQWPRSTTSQGARGDAGAVVGGGAARVDGTHGRRQRWEVAAQQGRGVSTTLRALPFACHLAHAAPHADRRVHGTQKVGRGGVVHMRRTQDRAHTKCGMGAAPPARPPFLCCPWILRGPIARA